MCEALQRANPSLSRSALNEEWLAYLRAAPDQLATRIEQAGWKVIRPPLGTLFLTSDIGLAKVLKDVESFVPYAPGWSGLDIGYRHWVFPLDPHSVLYIAPGINDGTIENAKRQSCCAINLRMIEQSLRYVFASSRNEDVQWLVTRTQRLDGMS